MWSSFLASHAAPDAILHGRIVGGDGIGSGFDARLRGFSGPDQPSIYGVWPPNQGAITIAIKVKDDRMRVVHGLGGCGDKGERCILLARSRAKLIRKGDGIHHSVGNLT